MNTGNEIVSAEYFILILIVTMIVFGSFGGVINYLIVKQKALSSNSKMEGISLSYCVLLGIAAAFLVPLFLVLMSSNIVERTSGGYVKFLTFAGLCLIAGISSTNFIQTISGSIMNKFIQSTEVESKVQRDESQANTEMEQKEIL